MNTMLPDEQEMLRASFLSTIEKLEKTMLTLQGKGASTALAERRLRAYRLGFAVVFADAPSYSIDELREGNAVLSGLIPSLERSYARLAHGSPQRTLLERRISSMRVAIGTIDELLGEHTT
nr:hypothetical protein [uncultured Sphaerochaeta sp.]